MLLVVAAFLRDLDRITPRIVIGGLLVVAGVMLISDSKRGAFLIPNPLSMRGEGAFVDGDQRGHEERIGVSSPR